MKRLRRHWIEVSLVVAMAVLTINLMIRAANATTPIITCLTPDQICDAYSSPSHTPWDTVEEYIPCLQGCLDEFWDCDEWDVDDVASCIECCYDFYFPRFEI